MFDISLKSRKILTSFFCLSLSFVLIASCAAPPLITLAKITSAAGTVLDLIEITEKILYLTSNSVNSSYEDLGEDIRSDYFVANKRFSDDIIENMEAQHKDLLSKHKRLDNSINKTNKAANELFSMLKKRTNQSTNLELKDKLLQDINVNKKAFEQRIKIADNASSKLKLSIKEYDNILIVFQVGVGLEELQKYVALVDSVISEYKLLNQEVEVALDEGRQLITNITNTPDKQAKSSLPKSTENKTPEQVANRPHLGVQIVTLTKDVRQKINQDKNLNFSVNAYKGVLIVKTGENSPAAKAGIKPGDIILKIDGKAVTDVSEVTAAIRKSQVGVNLPLEINRGQQRFEVLVPLEAKSNTSNLKEENKKANNIDINNTPENAIVEYYQLINQRQYSRSWAILSSRFKNLKPDNNYNNYQEWWEKVASTRIISMQLVNKNKNSAVVDAKLKYFLKDGRQLDDLSRFRLILNSNSKWLIDEKKKLEV